MKITQMMKYWSVIVSVLSSVSIASAAKVNTFVTVMDEGGSVVSNAEVSVCFVNNLMTGNGNVIRRGRTDNMGRMVINGSCKYQLGITARKTGYYRGWMTESFSDIENGNHFEMPTNGYVVLIKKAHGPSLMNKSPRDGFFKRWPTTDEWLGFDLQKWDFCSPHGSGEISDFLLRFTKAIRGKRDAHCMMEISFTNYPCAGCYIMRKDTSSDLKYVYCADTNKNAYTNYVKYEFERNSEHLIQRTELSDDEYMIIRTRTKLDDDGNIVSARYGLIAGKMLYANGFGFPVAWFNSKDNNPNLEDMETWEMFRRIYQRLDAENGKASK